MLPTNPTTIDYLRDILVQEMGVADSRVNIYNEKFNIPNDQHLFVGVAYKFSKVFGSKSETVQGTDFDEKQGLQAQEHYAIILFSRNHEALRMKERAVMALGSIYARQKGDEIGFKIARIAPIQDLSTLEGAAILYRYEIDVIMLCRYEYTKSVPWYGTFTGEVSVANGETVTTTIEPVEPV